MSESNIPLYKDPKQSIDARVADLLGRMTLEEKADQLRQDTIGKDANPNNVGPDNPFCPTVGSILSFPGGSKERNAYQRLAIEQTRLGIPIIWGFDVIHGWRTSFPAAIAQAASFEPSLTEALSRVSAEEAWADGGVDWTFSPMVEVCHDPRWGRVVEGYGEDPYTSSRFTEAAVFGYQGREPGDLAKEGHIAACLKHFVGYSASEGGRDYTYTDISVRALREWYLPPFEAGVRNAHARTLMSSFNDITGTPAVCNAWTLDTVLRREWGFDGFVVSDWGGVSQLKDQSCITDPGEQTIASLRAGNEMDMADGVFRCIPDLVKSGRLSMELVDRAVARVLRVKFELGLFEHPYAPERPTEETCYAPASLDLALRCARESAVLLRNEKSALPLKPRAGLKIAMIGPTADSRSCHIGCWRALSPIEGPDYAPTLFEQAKVFYPDADITCGIGCTVAPYHHTFGEGGWNERTPEELAAEEASDRKTIAEAVELAKAADVVLLCLGEEIWMTGEYSSRVEIELPGRQKELIRAVAALGKPMVALVVSGRPLALEPVLKTCDAVLYLWEGGCRGAVAAMEIVSGAVNPSGKLPMTFPRTTGQIPIYYNDHTRSRHWAHDYLIYPDGPQFPFGFGLSYTTFEYGAVSVEKKGSGFTASVSVKNTGDRSGKETVLWFLTDVEATCTQPKKRVVGFRKIELAPGEEKTVSIDLEPERDLAGTASDGSRFLEPGEFRISASGRSEASFRL